MFQLLIISLSFISLTILQETQDKGESKIPRLAPEGVPFFRDSRNAVILDNPGNVKQREFSYNYNKIESDLLKIDNIETASVFPAGKGSLKVSLTIKDIDDLSSTSKRSVVYLVPLILDSDVNDLRISFFAIGSKDKVGDSQELLKLRFGIKKDEP